MPIPISTKANQDVAEPACVTYRHHLASLLSDLHPDAVVISQTDSVTQSMVIDGPPPWPGARSCGRRPTSSTSRR